MTYDLSAPLHGGVDTDAAHFAPSFRGGAYDDATVDAFADELLIQSARTGVRASFVAAQIAKETGWFRFGGDVHPGQYNLAGLGATGGGATGLAYADIREGVRAVFAHHLTYEYGEIANWPVGCADLLPLDYRHDAVISAGKGGRVHLLGDFVNGYWAYTASIPEGSLENGYAEGILAIANKIVVHADVPPTPTTGGTMEPTAAEIGYPVEIDYATFVGPARALADIRWWVTHDTEGGEQGSEGVLKGPTASVHALIDRDGSLEFMVPLDTTAWTPGNDAVARASINVEKVGFAATGYTEEQYRSEAAFYRWCVAQGMTGVPAVYIGKADKDGGPLPDVAGMLGHEDVPNPNVPGRWGGVAGHTDPGPLWDWAHFVALCTGAPPAPGVSPTYRLFRETGHGIDNGFRTFWEGNGGLPIFGFPLTEEVTEGGRATQYFQRAVFRYFEEFKGTPYEVQCDLLGAAAAKAAGYTGPGIG